MHEENLRLSKLSESLAGSQILQYSNAVRAMKARGMPVNNYTVGDFDPSIFPIPCELKIEVMKAYGEDCTNYPAAEGNWDLRVSIARFESDFAGIDYEPDEVMVGSGGRPLIYAAFQVICDKEDTVLFGTPSWNNHYFVQTVGAKAVAIPTDPWEGFLLTPEKIAHHIKEATLLCLCSPQNPTGTVYTKETLVAITDLVVEENRQRGDGKKLYLLFDAMYGCLTSDGCHYNPLQLNAGIRPYLITVNAISKIFAATGMRVGWCLGPSGILRRMKNLLTHMGAWAPMAEQKAIARFLTQSEAVSHYLAKFREGVQQRLDMIYQGLMYLKQKGYPVDAIHPQGGIYLCVQFDLIGKRAEGKELQDAPGIARYLLEKSGFAVLPFSVFGSPEALSWFRISVGTCRMVDIPVMLKKLETVLYSFQINYIKETI